LLRWSILFQPSNLRGPYATARREAASDGLTSIPKDPRVSELRELFRNLEAFRTVYESTGVQEVTSDDGATWSLWDLEYLYRKAMELLTPRQSQAIDLYLVRNIREKDAARMMGVSETNPVAMYATLGLRRLLDLMESGSLSRFREGDCKPKEKNDYQTYLNKLASFIKTRVQVKPGHCWAYPCRADKAPAILVRTPTGITTLAPRNILYEVYVEPVWPGFELEHRLTLPTEFCIACINPWHQDHRLSEEEGRRLRLNVIRRGADMRARSEHVRSLGARA
jgi:hypothetical protein